MSASLRHRRVAFLAADGVEQSELQGPWEALEEAGAECVLIAPHSGAVQAVHHDEKADRFAVDQPLQEADAEAFDALILPGGLASPDTLRANRRAVAFVRAFGDTGRPLAAICHAPWLLIEAGLTRGRRMTSWPAIRSDLLNAGAIWEDEPVVVDTPLITSRKPADVPAFTARVLQAIREEPAVV